MQANLLNLEKAMEMYDLLAPYLPTEPTTQIKAIAGMVQKMGAQKYIRCLELLTGESRDTILKSDKNDRLTAFLTGFEMNHLLELTRLKMDGLHV